MSAYELQQVEHIVDRLDAIIAAGIETNRRTATGQALLVMQQDLRVVKNKVREAATPREAKPGEGKYLPAVVAAAEAALILLIAAMVTMICLQALVHINQQDLEAAGIAIWTAAAALNGFMSISLETLRNRLTIRTRTAELEIGHPCFPSYDCALAALRLLEAINRGGPTVNMPTDAQRTVILAHFETLRACVSDLIRCLDRVDSLGWWERLVGSDGIVDTTMRRFRLWLPPPIRFPRP